MTIFLRDVFFTETPPLVASTPSHRIFRSSRCSQWRGESIRDTLCSACPSKGRLQEPLTTMRRDRLHQLPSLTTQRQASDAALHRKLAVPSGRSYRLQRFGSPEAVAAVLLPDLRSARSVPQAPSKTTSQPRPRNSKREVAQIAHVSVSNFFFFWQCDLLGCWRRRAMAVQAAATAAAAAAQPQA